MSQKLPEFPQDEALAVIYKDLEVVERRHFWVRDQCGNRPPTLDEMRWAHPGVCDRDLPLIWSLYESGAHRRSEGILPGGSSGANNSV